ncbi:SDR family oxidoreductase [Porticoccaceae bacterium]|jgi:3-oxoacyl-[acyl-carrier protein] reductase|nr:SDR family oxidoreductase [Porticoccaceae bacterium]MDB9970850.1 SDR family oxidoreductase [Porticoccaceae bacterium]MDC1452992.1 SDR family oxidoreductase [Porticoccaceae bacterium]MDP4745152.1 SDR family oxidoreductase [Porticoccaceae bacterium]MDP5051183.1 SDR family oxidoreductase [Porticoccaceae bacterium]
MKHHGKIAVVTGGVRDIGRAISLKLAAEGAKVVVNYHGSHDLAQQTLDEIESAGGQAILFKGDMTSPADVEGLIAATKQAFGSKIDILVNVAGGLVARKTIDEMDLEFFNYVMQLNISSTFLVTKAVVPYMSKGASIINFSSQAGRDGGGPGASAYATSKGAVMSFTRAMAKELGPQGIRVNSLCCGMISTTFHDTFSKPEGRLATAGNTPLRREGAPNEVADTVSFLASSDAGFVSGTNMDVNGGLVFS